VKLYWSPRSPFVRKVMVAAHELGLADRIETIPTVVQMSKPHVELLQTNPVGKIPTLVLDDGTALFDSLTICEYLDSLAGGHRLFPREGAARWHVLTVHALGNGFMDLLVLWRNERDQPVAQQSPAWIENFRAKTATTLDRFEAMAPDLVATLVDIRHIVIGSALSYMDFRFAELGWRKGHTSLAAWHADFAQRPSMQATIGAAA